MSASDPNTSQESEKVSPQTSEEKSSADSVGDQASRLLQDAQNAIEQLDQATPAVAESFQLEDLIGHEMPPEKCSIDLLRDVDLDLRVELGRTHMLLEDILKLRRGSVVTLDKLAGDPVDLYANGRLVARGEIMVLNENFCVRVAELVSSEAIDSE